MTFLRWANEYTHADYQLPQRDEILTKKNPTCLKYVLKILQIYLCPIPEQVNANDTFHQSTYLIFFWYLSAVM